MSDQQPKTKKSTMHAGLHGATARGKRPSRSHDFYFLGGRNDRLAVVGREIRGDWPEQESEGGPGALRAFERIAVSFLPLGEGDPASLTKRFEEGFSRVVHECQRDLQQRGDAPALALTMAHAHHNHLYVGHVGDGRCYKITPEGLLTRISDDQTYTAQPPDRPLVSDPALSRNLSSVVGGFSDDLTIQTERIELAETDTVLLCSAGVARTVSDDALREAITETQADTEDAPLQRICNSVLAASGGTLDGADRTVVVARFA